jgi:hypothetical protein
VLFLDIAGVVALVIAVVVSVLFIFLAFFDLLCFCVSLVFVLCERIEGVDIF